MKHIIRFAPIIVDFFGAELLFENDDKQLESYNFR